MKKITFILFQILQWTWGFLQTFVGFIVFLRFINCKHSIYHGAILTLHKGNAGGFSLGGFIFVNGERDETFIEQVSVHEYGHAIQSLIYGPFYFFIVGIPSQIQCSSEYYRKQKEEKGIKYTSHFPESQANRLGYAFTKKQPCND